MKVIIEIDAKKLSRNLQRSKDKAMVNATRALARAAKKEATKARRNQISHMLNGWF